ncbi:MAG TPA: M36 family metallopeptidase [Pyrinomonadaceae bacterium]|nr:M36 family metallopeptidase [Pyrinomonadaceae bacterium]
MRHTNRLTQFRSFRYFSFVLVIGVLFAAIIAADRSDTTHAAFQPQPNPQRPQQSGLPNFDVRLGDKKEFEDFSLTSFPDRARARQNPRANARLDAVDELLRTAGPDLAQNLHAVANEFGAMKNVFVEGGTLSEPASDTPDNIARKFLSGHADLFAVKATDSSSLKLTNEDDDDGTAFLEYTQTVGGIKVYQGHVQVVVNKNGEVLSVREGFLVDKQPVRLRPTLNEARGIARAFEHAGKTVGDSFVETHKRTSSTEFSKFVNPLDASQREVLSELNVVRVADAARLAWHVYAHVGPEEYYELLVDAHTGELLLRNNLIVDAQGTVYPKSPGKGGRQLVSFPGSWLGTSVVTNGPNVDACVDANGDGACDITTGNFLVNGRAYAPNQDFGFPFSPADDPRLYPAAVVTNLFYFMNVIHDYSATLGFTTGARNMEGNDPVIALAQSVTGNAFFNCAPDGVRPSIQMGFFSGGDSSVDSDVAIHEYGHGIAMRLIGNCGGLNGIQSGAMNEGWADYFAVTYGGDGAVGEWATSVSGGFRRAVYSVPAASIHDSYQDLGNQGFETHNDGEIWAATLWDLRAQLGTSTVDRLVVQGMKFTPVGPSFLNARDGILSADQNLTGGVNRCSIWTVFARHGMGFSASGNDGTTHNAATDLPSSCTTLPPIYEGFVDGADCNQIWGWAWDQNRPNTAINVDIYANGAFVATVAANLFRQDLLNAGKGNGFHAFVFNVPSSLKNGQLKTITVRFGGTSTQLSLSPRIIVCNASMFPNDTPVTNASGGGSTWEQGVEFSSSVSGKIVAIRYWKDAAEPSGGHVGRIWSSSGNLLATASFSDLTSSGWQKATLSTPLSITAGTRYKVTYNVHSVVAKTFNVFANGPLDRPPFTIWGSSFCSPAGCFPTTGSTSNLFADIVFNSPQ